MIRLGLCIGVTLSLMACSNGGGLRSLPPTSGGPDEFRVMPVNPLVLPTDLTTLPTPTPGGTNLTDPNPQGDAVAVLGGNPNALIAGAGGLPARDVALVNAASRNGVDPAIRQTLASEDADFRRRAGRLSFFRFGDRYFRAYSRQALDAQAELERFRAAGIATPSAPPQ